MYECNLLIYLYVGIYPSDIIPLNQRFLQSLKHFWNALFGMANSSCFDFSRFISSIVANRFPFIAVFSFGERKKLTWTQSGEYGDWGMITILFLAKNSSTSINVCELVRYHSAKSMIDFSTILSVSDELLWAIGSSLQGSIPYWPYDLVARIHDSSHHYNRRKQWVKLSHLIERRASSLTSSRSSLNRLYHNWTCVLLIVNLVNISNVLAHLISFFRQNWIQFFWSIFRIVKNRRVHHTTTTNLFICQKQTDNPKCLILSTYTSNRHVYQYSSKKKKK